jgi:hypothetical protein
MNPTSWAPGLIDLAVGDEAFIGKMSIELRSS